MYVSWLVCCMIVGIRGKEERTSEAEDSDTVASLRWTDSQSWRR